MESNLLFRQWANSPVMNPELIQLSNLNMILLSVKLDFLLTSFVLGLESYFLLQGTLEKVKKRINLVLGDW